MSAHKPSPQTPAAETLDAAPNAASAASKSGTWILFEIIADVFIRLKTCAFRRRSLPDHAFLYEVRAELYMNAMCICVKSGREISKIQTTYGFDFWVKFSGFCWFDGGTVLVLPIYRALRVTTLEVSPKGANAVAALYPLDPRDGSGRFEMNLRLIIAVTVCGASRPAPLAIALDDTG